MDIVTLLKFNNLPAIMNDPERFLRDMEIELPPGEAGRFESTVNAVVCELFVEEIFDDKGGYVFGRGGGGGGSSSSSGGSSSVVSTSTAFDGASSARSAASVSAFFP